MGGYTHCRVGESPERTRRERGKGLRRARPFAPESYCGRGFGRSRRKAIRSKATAANAENAATKAGPIADDGRPLPPVTESSNKKLFPPVKIAYAMTEKTVASTIAALPKNR